MDLLVLDGGVLAFSIDFGASDSVGEVSMATFGVLQDKGDIETRLYLISEMKLDIDSSLPRENRICLLDFDLAVGVLESSAKSALFRLKLSSGESPENICVPYGVAKVSLRVDKGVIPWMFKAPGLPSPISRLSLGGESNIVLCDDENDIGSVFRFDDCLGVIFILMNGVLSSLSASVDFDFFGEYDIGVFALEVGLGAKGTLVEEDFEEDAEGIGFPYAWCMCGGIMPS